MHDAICRIESSDCVGCKACGVVCPVNAIAFKRDREGFERPILDTERCIRCGKCVSACPAAESADVCREASKVYAARNRDSEVLQSSSSGGVFTACANHVIEKGGCVYGVCFDEEFRVVYRRGTSMDDIRAMRGSKYVEAYVGLDLLQRFIDDVQSGMKILFSGTPCQILGMKKLCGQKRLSVENIIWVDFFVCSGKISAYLWDKERQGYLTQGRLEEVSFRCKKNGWKNYAMHRKIDGVSYDDDFYVHRWSKFFGNSVCRRKTCKIYKGCGYQGTGGGADISLGDMWHSMPLPRSWRDNRGISLVGVSTTAGQELMNAIKDQLELVDITGQITEHTERKTYDMEKENLRRKAFWDVYHNQGWEALCDRYARVTMKDKILLGIIRPILIKTGLLDMIKKR